MLGDLYETLVYFERNEKTLSHRIEEVLYEKSEIRVLKGPEKAKSFIRIKTYAPLDNKQIDAISLEDEKILIKILPPVLPILTPGDVEVPFTIIL